MELSTIKLNLKKLYYNSLILQLKKNKNNTEYIEELLKNLNNDIIESETNTIINTDTDIKTEDDYIYKKEWNKLNNIHKIIKIKEYINSLPINNTLESELLKGKLVKLVKTRKITKKDSVIYDTVNYRIINIKCLKIENNKYCIKI